jgi:hypothetical protein
MIITKAMRLADVGQRMRWFAQQSEATAAPTPSGTWYRLCLMAARIGAGVPALYPEADIAWTHTRYRTEPQSRPPAGWLVWYDRGPAAGAAGDRDAGHVITSAGNGLGWSNDVKRTGRLDLVKLTAPVEKWGYRYVGCSRDLNGVLVVPKDTRVPPAPDKPRPRVLTVRAGDTISALVAEHAHGRVEWRDVWLDPHNAALRRLRGKPELIRAGDHLWVP